MKTSEKILIISTVFLSLLALFVSIRQTSIMADMKQAAVWPYVQVGTSFQTNKLVIDVDNDGVGPAKIKEMYYTYNDSTFNYIQNLVWHIAKSERIKISELSYSNLEGGIRVLKAGQNQQILRLDGSHSAIDSMWGILPKISIHITFCSIYDECWTNDNGLITKN